MEQWLARQAHNLEVIGSIPIGVIFPKNLALCQIFCFLIPMKFKIRFTAKSSSIESPVDLCFHGRVQSLAASEIGILRITGRDLVFLRNPLDLQGSTGYIPIASWSSG